MYTPTPMPGIKPTMADRLHRFLLAQGADPNVSYTNSFDEVRTPLMDAVKAGSYEVIDLLIKNGARCQEADREFILRACPETPDDKIRTRLFSCLGPAPVLASSAVAAADPLLTTDSMSLPLGKPP